jgi:hypothetical protein
MKKIFFLFFFLPFFTSSHAGKRTDIKTDPRVVFDKIWVDYDVYDDDLKGMRLHLKFHVYGMKDVDAVVACFFENNGTRLRDKNKKFYSDGGDVALYKDIKPGYESTDYNDLQVFMPYSELDLDPGKYNLSMEIKLIYPDGTKIQHLTYYDFEYTKPGSTTTTSNSTLSTAEYKDMSVDYDVTEDGRKGMRLHVKFSVFHMKNVDSYLAIYFQTRNGDAVKSKNADYRSDNGQLAAYFKLNPGYDPETVYSDAQVFIPYSAFDVPSGRNNLTMDVDVIRKDGDIIKHLKYYDFWLE